MCCSSRFWENVKLFMFAPLNLRGWCIKFVHIIHAFKKCVVPFMLPCTKLCGCCDCDFLFVLLAPTCEVMPVSTDAVPNQFPKVLDSNLISLFPPLNSFCKAG